MEPSGEAEAAALARRLLVGVWNQLRAMLNAYQIEAPRCELYSGPSQATLAALRLPEAELQAAFDALRAVLERLQAQVRALSEGRLRP